MIRNRVFNKGEIVHALISPRGNFNQLFPVRGIVHDIKYGDTINEYQIKVEHFFDDVQHIKHFIIGLSFSADFDMKTTKLRVRREPLLSKDLFDEYFKNRNNDFMVVVNGPMVTKLKHEMISLFNNVNSFFIEKNLHDLFELCNHSFYSSGPYYYASHGVFKAHLIKFLGDRGFDNDTFVDDILKRPNSKQLDRMGDI